MDSAELVPALLVLTGCIQKTRSLISNHIDKFLDLQVLYFSSITLKPRVK